MSLFYGKGIWETFLLLDFIERDVKIKSNKMSNPEYMKVIPVSKNRGYRMTTLYILLEFNICFAVVVVVVGCFHASNKFDFLLFQHYFYTQSDCIDWDQ